MNNPKSSVELIGCFNLLGIIAIFICLVFPYNSFGIYSIFIALGAYEPGIIATIIGAFVTLIILADLIYLVSAIKSKDITGLEKLRLNSYYTLAVINFIILIASVNMFHGSNGEEAMFIVISFSISFSLGLIILIKYLNSRERKTIPTAKGILPDNQKLHRSESHISLQEQREHEIKLAKIKYGRSTFNFGNWWINKVIAPVIIGCILGAVSYIFTGEANIGGITSIGGFVGSMLLNIDYT